jgi:hypothetical protein
MPLDDFWDARAAARYDTPGTGQYTLVYLVYNTISNLQTQAEQVACFRRLGPAE